MSCSSAAITWPRTSRSPPRTSSRTASCPSARRRGRRSRPGWDTWPTPTEGRTRRATAAAVTDVDPFLVELGLENVHPVDEQAEDGRFQRQMDTLLGYVGLLNAILPRFGVHAPAMIFDSGATSLHTGPIIALQTADGWQIGDFPYEEPDLTVPKGAAFDWNDVFDAALAARENQRKGDGSADHYLAVINAAMQIRTVAAYAWVEAYSDTTSPAHEMAVQELARALGREAYLEAAGG